MTQRSGSSEEGVAEPKRPEKVMEQVCEASENETEVTEELDHSQGQGEQRGHQWVTQQN